MRWTGLEIVGVISEASGWWGLWGGGVMASNEGSGVLGNWKKWL